MNDGQNIFKGGQYNEESELRKPIASRHLSSLIEFRLSGYSENLVKLRKIKGYHKLIKNRSPGIYPNRYA